MNKNDKFGIGLYVQASSQNVLDGLLEYHLNPRKLVVPVRGKIARGPVLKEDVMKASVMSKENNELAFIFAYNVKVTPEAQELADQLGLKIHAVTAVSHSYDISIDELREAAHEAVFPCIMKILPDFVTTSPNVLGVDILEGIARVGTPICIPQRDFIDVGQIASIEIDGEPVESAKRGNKVVIKMVGSGPEDQQKMVGMHFELDDMFVSRISRRSINVLKANYRGDLTMDDWKLVVKLKTLFKIP